MADGGNFFDLQFLMGEAVEFVHLDVPVGKNPEGVGVDGGKLEVLVVERGLG